VGEVERIEAIVDDLTFLARSDEGRMELAVERVEVDELLFGEASRLQRRGRVIADASDVMPVVVRADRGHLARAVRNLVDNAERHAETTVRLGVDVTPDGSNATIDVDDDGAGISIADRAGVFDRFARLDDSRERATAAPGSALRSSATSSPATAAR
jgi:signal transduction histidine kinase